MPPLIMAAETATTEPIIIGKLTHNLHPLITTITKNL